MKKERKKERKKESLRYSKIERGWGGTDGQYKERKKERKKE